MTKPLDKLKSKQIKVGVNTTVTLADKEWILAKVKEWNLRGEGAVIERLIEKEKERESR